MTSDTPPAASRRPEGVYVWTWLAGASEPVVAGQLVRIDQDAHFIYGRSYRERANAVPLYLPELPILDEAIAPPPGLPMASAFRDAAPDAWGRRVILNRLFGARGTEIDALELDEFVFLLESGSDRIGALDFQTLAKDYVPRGGKSATLTELIASAERVERNLPLSPELDQALHHGSSIGGARPKALITDGDRKFVAKFSSTSDTYSVVKGEYIAMRLAGLAGLDVAPVSLVQASGRDVLLVERFDRVRLEQGWGRRTIVSALTILGLDEMQARYASYQDLAETVRLRFTDVTRTLHELFARLIFNILVGNVDDHARNHAAFWDGAALALTPAYDICPQARAGGEATQAMLIHDQVRVSQIAACLAAAHHFHLSEDAALDIAAEQIETIGRHWRPLCDEADLGEIDRTLFWGRQFLNPFAFYELDGKAAALADRATDIRGTMG